MFNNFSNKRIATGALSMAVTGIATLLISIIFTNAMSNSPKTAPATADDATMQNKSSKED